MQTVHIHHQFEFNQNRRQHEIEFH